MTTHAFALRSASPGQGDAEFQRFYQQAYYQHSGFDELDDYAGAQRERARQASLRRLTAAALALIFFVVPAITAALVV